MSFMGMRRLSVLTILILIIFPNLLRAEIVGKIEAHVGNRIITAYDVANLDPITYKKILAITDKETRDAQLKQYHSQAVDFLINQYVIEISAEREGIKVTEEEIDKAIEEVAKANKITKKQLEDTLLKEGISMEKYRYQLKSQIINVRIRNMVLMPKIVITEEDLEKMADEKADEYGIKDKYNIRIIHAQTKKEINKIRKEIEKGLPFAEAAKKYSLDPSAAEGGSVGWIDVTYVPIEMERALKASKKGEITKPFEYEGMWAICYIEDFADKYNFDNETRVKLTNAVGEKLFSNVFNQWLKRNQETIVIIKAGDRFEVK